MSFLEIMTMDDVSDDEPLLEPAAPPSAAPPSAGPPSAAPPSAAPPSAGSPIGEVQQRITRSVVKRRKRNGDSDNSNHMDLENRQQDMNCNNKQGGNIEKDCGDWKQKYEELLTMHNDKVNKFEVKVKELENKVVTYKDVADKHEKLVQQLRDKVQCPVCLEVPKQVPIPVCPNGHVVCNECLRENCPICRVKMGKGKSSLAVTVLESIDHPCDNAGCKQTVPFGELSSHGKSCVYRLVNCPGLTCNQMVSLATLTTHILSCGCVAGNKIKDYNPLREFKKNVLVSHNILDENVFWKFNAISFDENVFLLKVARPKGIKGSEKWIFLVQFVGGEEKASKYGVSVIVHRPEEGREGKYSQRYNGDVCPIDVTTMDGAEEKGLCLSLTDGAMDKLMMPGVHKSRFSVSVNLFKTDIAVQ